MINRNQSDKKEMNEKEMELMVRNLTSWDDWHKLEETLFRKSEWEQSSLERMDEDLDREEIYSEDGTCWQPFHIPYEIDIDKYSLYEKMSYLAYEIIERIIIDKTQYDKKCNYCRVWTDVNSKQYCDFCQRPLQVLSRNQPQ